MCQKFLLSLPPGPKDADTIAFDAQPAKFFKPKPKQVLGKEWMSKGTWPMIVKWASLLQSGQIWQDITQRMT
jgi:hypothetical protein